MAILNSFFPVNNYDFRASCSEVNGTCYSEFEYILDSVSIQNEVSFELFLIRCHTTVTNDTTLVKRDPRQ